MMSEDPESFKRSIQRGLNAARRRIQREEEYERIGDEARERALNLLNYAYRLPELWPDTYELLLAMIPKMEMAGHRENWSGFLTKGASVSRIADDVASHGELCLAIGQLELLVTKLDDAEVWFQRGKESFRRIGDQSGQGRALNRLAVVELHLQNYSASLKLAQEALSILPSNHTDRANGQYVLGSNSSVKQNWVEAEKHYRTALALWMEAGDQRRIAWALSNLGPVLRYQDRLEDAINCLEQALSTFTQIHDPANKAIVQMNLANAYEADNRFDNAVSLLIEAQKIFLRFGDELNLARAALNLGRNYASLRKWKLSKDAYHESIRLWKHLGITASLCNALDCLGEMFLASDEFEHAIEVFQRGLDYLEIIPDNPRYEYLKTILSDHLLQAKGRQTGNSSPSSPLPDQQQ